MSLEAFNAARELYLQNDLSQSLAILNSIPGLDSLYIQEELESNSGNLKYLETLIETKSGELMGIFECPYHPYLALEYSKVLDVMPTIEIKSRFSNIRSVRQIESTVGIAHDQVVAIFPENFRSITPSDDHPVFYFVDKFARRHLKYTRPLIEGDKLKSLFSPLICLPEEKIGQLIANWVNVHESSHRLGLMPIPEYLFEKSNRYTAALEELRADLHTINICLSKSSDESSDEYLTGLYVLAERLLAYPLFRDKTNFDAISSVIMWKFLDQNEAFTNGLNLKKVKESVQALINEVAQFEAQCLKEKTPELRKARLRSLVLQFLGNYEKEYANYLLAWGLK